MKQTSCGATPSWWSEERAHGGNPDEPREYRDRHGPQILRVRVFLGGMFISFMMAGILWLASWIMHVGLGVRNEADELRREAELVV